MCLQGRYDMRKVMKYGISLFLSIGIVVGCCANSNPVMAAEEITEDSYEGYDEDQELDLSEVETTEELSEIIEDDVKATIDGLIAEYEAITSVLSDFDAYLVNPALTEEFYRNIIEETEALSIRLRDYALRYAEIIIDADTDFDDKYDDLEDIYEEIYEDAADEIYDEIYDNILDDMYDNIYDGIIDDAYETVEYDIWNDARSSEYSMWDEARSEVYSSYDNVRSDIYLFYDKLRSHTYKEKVEKINKDIDKFQKKIFKLKGIDVESPVAVDLTTLDLSTITTTEEMNAIVEADVETMVSSLYSELELLQTEIDSYEKYKANSSKTEDFYDRVTEEVEKASGRLREYTLRYAEIITESGMTFEDQYDELSDITDAIYSDAGSTLNHEIYGGVLKNAMKYFYNQILKSGFDVAPYGEVSSFRSDEYSNASDARSDVYSEISDLRSDVYSFISDMRSATWGKDSEKVDKEIEKFRKKTEKYTR